MNAKIIFACFVLFVSQYDECQAGFGGGFAGGFGGAGGAGGYGGAGGMAAINQLRFKLIIAKQQATLAKDNANTTILNNIALAQTAIDGEVTAAKNKASAVVGSASCVTQQSAALALVNSELVKTNCDQSVQFLAIDNQILLLSGMHSEMSMVYKMCPFWPPTLQATCIENFVLDFSTKLDTSVTSITDAVNTATSDSATCVASETQAAHDAITKANNDLDQCVASTA